MRRVEKKYCLAGVVGALVFWLQALIETARMSGWNWRNWRNWRLIKFDRASIVLWTGIGGVLGILLLPVVSVVRIFTRFIMKVASRHPKLSVGILGMLGAWKLIDFTVEWFQKHDAQSQFPKPDQDQALRPELVTEKVCFIR